MNDRKPVPKWVPVTTVYKGFFKQINLFFDDLTG